MRTSTPSSSGSSASDVFPDGRCFLALFADEFHSDVLSFLAPSRKASPDDPPASAVHYLLLGRPGNTSWAYPGRFRLTFGTPRSVTHTNKYLVHVERVSPEVSLLTWRDVVAVVPSAARYGGVGEDPQPHPAPVRIPAPAGVPGTLFDPLTIQRTVRVAQVLTGKEGQGLHLDLEAVRGDFKRWSEFQPATAWVRLQVRFIPKYAALTHHVHFRCAWYPGSRAAPTEEKDFESLAGHSVHVLSPGEYRNGAGVLTVPAFEAEGVSFRVKPPPTYGGTARFACVTSATCTGEEPLDEKTPLFDVYVDGVMHVPPEARV